MRHWTEFFLIHTSKRLCLCPTLPTDCVQLKSPRDLRVPAATISADTERRRIATTRDSPAWAQERVFLPNILFFAWPVLGLLCLLHAAYIRKDFSTKCHYEHLYSLLERPPGTRRGLFSLSLRLMTLVRTLGVEKIPRRASFYAELAHELLDGSGSGKWQRTPGFAWYIWNASMRKPFSEGLPAATVAASRISTPPGPLFCIAPPRGPEIRRASALRRIEPSATCRVSGAQLKPEEAVFKANASSQAEPLVPIHTVSFCLPSRLPAVMAEQPAETGPCKYASKTDMDDSAAQQTATVPLQALCRLHGVSPPRAVSDPLFQARELSAKMAPLVRTRVKRDALKTSQEASQKALSVPFEVMHDAIEGLLSQQQVLIDQYGQIASPLSDTTSPLASRRATRGASGTYETFLLRLRAHAHRRTGSHPSSV